MFLVLLFLCDFLGCVDKLACLGHTLDGDGVTSVIATTFYLLLVYPIYGIFKGGACSHIGFYIVVAKLFAVTGDNRGSGQS